MPRERRPRGCPADTSRASAIPSARCSRAVYDDVLAGRPSSNPRYANFAAGHEEMLIGDAVLESARAGTWVKVQRI